MIDVSAAHPVAPSDVERDREADREADLEAVLDLLTRDGRVPAFAYKRTCLHRRVAVRVRATGCGSVADYADLLRADAAEWPRLREALTVNVTSFWRDPDVFEALEREVLPALCATVPDGPVRGWSAGCASGEEAWSLATLLAAQVGPSRVAMLATDIDARSLETARTARYPAAAVARLPGALRAAWWGGGDPCEPRPALRVTVTVGAHDLLRDPLPADRLHVVTCRNLLIYCTPSAQATVLTRLADALLPGGVLVLGPVEHLVGPAAERFRPLDARRRLYRRRA